MRSEYLGLANERPCSLVPLLDYKEIFYCISVLLHNTIKSKRNKNQIITYVTYSTINVTKLCNNFFNDGLIENVGYSESELTCWHTVAKM